MSKSDWILALYKDYVSRLKRKPVFASDWDTLNDRAEYPVTQIRKALIVDTRHTYPYTFSDEQEEIKQMVLGHLPNCGLGLHNLAISISATAALYLTMLALYRKGLRRFLIFTPAYYSVIETLEEFGAEVYHYHLLDDYEFAIDPDRLQKMMTEYKIDGLIVTDPVYCVGKDISAAVLSMLVDTCNQMNAWFILDNTLGGMLWNEAQPTLFNHQKIDIISKAGKYVIVDSLTKRLLVNGLKHALVISNEIIIEVIEDAASQVYGGFCFPQLQLMRELYDQRSKTDITEILQHNIRLIKDNYELLNSFLKGSEFELYKVNSGYYTMIRHKQYLCTDVDIEAQIKTYLYKFNMFLLPTWYFNFNENNHFAIRVNLLKETSLYLPSLENCIGEKMELLH